MPKWISEDVGKCVPDNRWWNKTLESGVWGTLFRNTAIVMAMAIYSLCYSLLSENKNGIGEDK